MKLKQLFTALLVCSLLSPSYAQEKPKYIFYMIGDGMGLNQVNITEMYLASLENRIGVSPLIFSNFPVASFATTYSKSNGITDSAAGGTALAVGSKTKNGMIGMDSTGTENLRSIAYDAKAKGMKVGITTSVSIDHATPASFYAHQPSRSNYYEIASEIGKSAFDFFAGSGFLSPTKNSKKEAVKPITDLLGQSGFQVVHGLPAYNKLTNKNKVVLLNNKGASSESLNFAIDQKAGDLTLTDITKAAIQSLDNEKGFFLMVEGGKIDWSAHSNDVATTIHEVLDFNESVRVAYEFYKQYPNETLIVITADHETGGLTLGTGGSSLNFKSLASQKVSQGALSEKIAALRASSKDVTWTELKDLLAENLGLWTSYPLAEKEENSLKEAYQASFVNHVNETSKSLYANDDKIASLAIQTLNKIAKVSWGSGNHSAGYVPVYVIGNGAQEFTHKMENTDIPKKIKKVAGL